MSLMKYDPLREFDAISREFDSFFNQLRPTFEAGLTQQMYSPKVDIHQDNKHIYIEAELPGMRREDVKISINEDKFLVIKGEKRSERRWGAETEENRTSDENKNGKESKSKAEKSAEIESRNGGSVMRAERQPLRIERSYGSFTRTFTLPETADTENIDAKFENGVLEITVPKKEPAKPKQIDVNIK